MTVEKFDLINKRNYNKPLDSNELEVIKKAYKPLRENLNHNLIVNGTVEILNQSLILDPFKPYIDFPGIRVAPRKYIEKELNWYLSQNKSIDGYVDDVKIWKEVATEQPPHQVNSNYGYYVFSPLYGDGEKSQYEFALDQLIKSPNGRQSVMFYNRPNMQWEWNDNLHAKHDFTCCFQTWQAIRNNTLEMTVLFRSNDIVFGLTNDFAWACFVYQKLFTDLIPIYPTLKPGHIHWFACSLHLYERHFDLLRLLTDTF